jgi:hypothetical protein
MSTFVVQQDQGRLIHQPAHRFLSLADTMSLCPFSYRNDIGIGQSSILPVPHTKCLVTAGMGIELALRPEGAHADTTAGSDGMVAGVALRPVALLRWLDCTETPVEIAQGASGLQICT